MNLLCILISTMFFLKCGEKKGHVIPGDSATAIRLFLDTTGPRIFVLSDSNRYEIRVIGKHWLTNQHKDERLVMILDKKELAIKSFPISPDGSFDIRVHDTLSVGNHIVRVKEYHDTVINKAALYHFSILSQDKDD